MQWFSRIGIVTLFLLVFKSNAVLAQRKGFEGALFFNANGVHLVGAANAVWNTQSGTNYGGGGISTGMSVSHRVSRKQYFSLEIRYIQKGSVLEYLNAFGGKAFESYRLHYMEVPVLFGHEMKSKQRSYKIETGLGFAHLFNSKHPSFENWVDSESLKAFKNFDLSWISTFKFSIGKNEKERVWLGFRYSHSILSVHKNYPLRNMDYGIQLDYVFK